jgi:hypothetical protein
VGHIGAGSTRAGVGGPRPIASVTMAFLGRRSCPDRVPGLIQGSTRSSREMTWWRASAPTRVTQCSAPQGKRVGGPVGRDGVDNRERALLSLTLIDRLAGRH